MNSAGPENLECNNQFKSEQPFVVLDEVRDSGRLCKELAHVALSAMMTIGAVAIMIMSQVLADFVFYYKVILVNENAPDNHFAQNPLYDPLIDFFGTKIPSHIDRDSIQDLIDARAWLPDILLFSHVSFCTVGSIFFPRKFLKEPRIYAQLLIVRRFLIILSMLYAMRSIMIVSTSVPSPLNRCPIKTAHTWGDLFIVIGMMTIGRISACTDNIYSAHTVLAFLSLLFTLTYCRFMIFWLIGTVSFMAMAFSLVVTRLHYTVDVLLAIIVTFYTHCLYHLVIQNPSPNTNHMDEHETEASSLPKSFATCVRRVICTLDGKYLRMGTA